MSAIVFEVTMLVLVVAFVIYLAMDDRKNQRIRAEEDRVKAQEAAKPVSQNSERE